MTHLRAHGGRPGRADRVAAARGAGGGPRPAGFGARTMDDVVAGVFAQRRFQLQVIGAFATVALLLAALGIYGVTAFWVNQRTQEIGIRIALGARGGDVVGMVMRQGVALTLWGMLAGLAGALPFEPVAARAAVRDGLLRSRDFIAIAALLLATAMAACYLPARRATRVDPDARATLGVASRALRYDLRYARKMAADRRLRRDRRRRRRRAVAPSAEGAAADASRRAGRRPEHQRDHGQRHIRA